MGDTASIRKRPLSISISILFIVLALFAAWVVYPNIREGLVVLQRNDAVTDMRYVATAIEAYYSDHQAYPTHHISNALNADSLVQGRRDLQINQPTFQVRTHAATLTTPVAYMTGYFSDPFAPYRGMSFRYFATEDWWMAWSAGPNQEYDLDYREIKEVLGDDEALWDLLLRNAFDPTNGTVSSGDIWRMKE